MKRQMRWMSAVVAVLSKVVPLTEGVMKSMFMTKLKTTVTVLLLASLIAFGGGLLSSQMAAGQQVQPPAVSSEKARPPEGSKEKSEPPTSKAGAPQPFPAPMNLAFKAKEALTVILENGKLIIEPGAKVRLTPVKTEKGHGVRLEWSGVVVEALRMKIETSTQILEVEGAPGGAFTARNLQKGALDLKEKKSSLDLKEKRKPKKDADPKLDFGKDAEPKKDFAVTPGQGFRVPAQEDRRNFRVTPKEHRYDGGNLPRTVRAKAGEPIVVTYRINPADVEEIKCRSDSRDVTIKGEGGNGIIRIVAHGPKSVVSGKPTRARRKSPATALSVWSHWKMPTYWACAESCVRSVVWVSSLTILPYGDSQNGL
jgi:hypothetical protein